MFKSNIEIYELTNAESKLLAHEIDRIREINDGRECAPEILGQIIASRLQTQVLLTGLKRARSVAALKVENLPRFGANDQEGAAILSATLGYLGEYGWAFQWGEQASSIFMPIVPSKKAALQSNGSFDRFDVHSDDAIAPQHLRPEVLLLYGIRNEARARTGVVSARQIADALPKRMLAKATQRSFSIRAPASFRLDGFTVENEPIFEPHVMGLGIRFPSYATLATDPQDALASATIEAMRAIADESIVWTMIEPGTALMVNNLLCCHAREPIVGNRLLMRSYWGYGVPELRKLQPKSKDVFSIRRLFSLDIQSLKVAA
jgi:Taurine catabolism dioxygenase TauD, TfdA family